MTDRSDPSIPESSDLRPEGKPMSLVGHLSELRKRMLIAGGSFIIASFASFGFADSIAQFLMKPASNLTFVYLSPSELFVTYTKLAMLSGLILTLPIIIYEIWAFINPALKKKERRVLAGALFTGGLFFAGGAAFAFFVVVPMTIRFFLSYSLPNTQAMFAISNYFSFLFDLLLSFGAAFELPIICTVLGSLGLISYDLLRRTRRFAIMAILVIAAILSPPDVISQILLAIPMLGLFELSLFILKIMGARRAREKARSASLA